MNLSVGKQLAKGTEMANVIGYLRVSTPGQADDGVSLEAQQARIEAYSLANGLELSELFIDAGVSGKRADNRPELQKALDRASREGAVLIVYSLSRLARSTRDTIDIGERLDKAGADLVSLSEKIDTTTAAGKMVFRMLAVMAEFERDLVSERTASAMSYKRSQGERVGTVPYGFDLAADGINLLENTQEQAALKIIDELHGAGMSLRKIASELNGRSITTKGGNKAWSHTTVQRIVKRLAAKPSWTNSLAC